MKLRWLVIGGIGAVALLFVLFFANQPPPNLRNPKMLDDISLVTADPCAAPCWNNITPGETTWTEALTVIEDNPTFNDPEIINAQEGSAVGAQWSKREGDPCCQIVSEDGKTVSFISLSLAPEITLRGLRDAQGDPTYALGASVSGDQAVVYLFYPEKSMIVIAFVAGAEAELNADSEIIGVLYATPKDMELTLQTSKLHAWEGYAPFKTYKSDAADEDFEVTPSVTLTPAS
jgi:hypothetical protein